MKIVVLGAPGAGKGTQAQQIYQKAGIPLVVMGDIFRAAISAKNEIGRQVEKSIDQGKLVPDELVIQVLKERLKRKDCQKGYLLDGFPRTIQQAKALDQALKQKGTAIDHVVYFAIPDNIVLERICGRRTCKNCNAIYHLRYSPPARENVCDKCGSELFHRADDTKDVVEKRLEAYYTATAPLLSYYHEQNLLREVDANRSVDEILQDTLKILKLA